MLATHRDAEKRYGKVRQDIISQLNKGYTSNGENAFCAKLFDNDSLNKMLEWGYSLKRRAEWDWVKLYASFQARNPKRFEMALWYKGNLISASLGKPS